MIIHWRAATFKRNSECEKRLFILAAARQNQQNDVYARAQRRLRSAWASAQSDQSLHCPHEETLGP